MRKYKYKNQNFFLEDKLVVSVSKKKDVIYIFLFFLYTKNKKFKNAHILFR